MADYKPEYRRPIADPFRATAHAAVRLCVRWDIHPDTISYASIAASAVAAVCLWRAADHWSLLLVAPLFCYLRLWCNMLDGMVAMASGKASWRGEILNDLPDRLSDVLVFAGLAHSGLCRMELGYLTALAAVLTAYVGMMGQAVRVQREFSGVMSKPWRMVTLHIGVWTAVALWWAGLPVVWGGWTVLDATCAVIILGCVQTIWIRLVRITRALRDKAAAAQIQAASPVAAAPPSASQE